jgi:two-component system sensor histidine kinase GlrK
MMQFRRPKSLSGLLLIGFALVAIPLLVAVVHATIQMRQLTRQSEELVRYGVAATRHTQELYQQANALQRTAGLYQLMGDENLKVDFTAAHDKFVSIITDLNRIQTDDATHRLSELIRGDETHLVEAVAASDGSSQALSDAIDRFVSVYDPIDALGRTVHASVDARLTDLQVTAERTQGRLYWQAAALAPVTFVIVLVFVNLLARPIRQIDQAISELGRGTFSRPIEVHGPSDLERLGRQLEWLRSRLLDLAQEKNRFLRHMSHELKTPLANIREGTELLIEGAVGELDANQREVASILRENGIKLQRLIENLLSYSAWQAKSVGLELSQFPLRNLVSSVIGAQQLTLVANRIHVDLDVDDIQVTADRGKLRLILDNLLSNAVKFTPREGKISIHGHASKDQLVIDLIDSGPGIPAEDRGHIFEAFYTGAGGQSGKLKGTGIGLSVVMEFVQAHGGTIEVVDGPRRGAHFRIWLPARPATGTGGSEDEAAA